MNCQSQWGLIHVQIAAWSHWVACVFRSFKGLWNPQRNWGTAFLVHKWIFSQATTPRMGMEIAEIDRNWVKLWVFWSILKLFNAISFTWAIYWAIPNSGWVGWGITGLPWALKPIIGLMSDMFPLGTGLGLAFILCQCGAWPRGFQASWMPRWLPQVSLYDCFSNPGYCCIGDYRSCTFIGALSLDVKSLGER